MKRLSTKIVKKEAAFYISKKLVDENKFEALENMIKEISDENIRIDVVSYASMELVKKNQPRKANALINSLISDEKIKQEIFNQNGKLKKK